MAGLTLLMNQQDRSNARITLMYYVSVNTENNKTKYNRSRIFSTIYFIYSSFEWWYQAHQIWFHLLRQVQSNSFRRYCW